ncbi:MAG TPA: rhodanese-like domain-containing protein [Syntrophales bacterium]|nr:rhodanese-like domain-containing protein [Syntrophales bacterium]
MINNITKEGLRSMMLSGEDFILIDTLSRESFEEIHISGAINCPVDEMGKWAEENEDKKDKKMIVYCGSYTCKASATAADILDRAGFARVMRYEGGIKEWNEAGYPVSSLYVQTA